MIGPCGRLVPYHRRLPGEDGSGGARRAGALPTGCLPRDCLPRGCLRHRAFELQPGARAPAFPPVTGNSCWRAALDVDEAGAGCLEVGWRPVMPA
jgi:hypothetical protein